MDPSRIDALARSLRSPRSRRRLVALAAGLAGSAVGVPAEAVGVPAEAGSPRKHGKKPPSCPAGQRRCDGACIDPATDPANCGGCGRACAAGWGCAGGTCCLLPTSSAAAFQGAVDATPAGGTLRLCGGGFRVSAEIRQHLTLAGAGRGRTVLSGGGAGRVLAVDAGATVAVHDLQVDGGSVTGTGGAILNRGRLSLTAVDVTGSFASLNGGGIANDGGSLTLDGCGVTGNQAGQDGGGIVSTGSLILRNGCRVTANSAIRDGGGIATFGPLTIRTGLGPASTVVSGNGAAQDGGGLLVAGGATTVGAGAFVEENHAQRNGGGVCFDARTPGTSLALPVGCRVTGNGIVGSGDGGGVYSYATAGVTVGDERVVTGNEPDDCAGDSIPRHCLPA